MPLFRRRAVLSFAALLAMFFASRSAAYVLAYEGFDTYAPGSALAGLGDGLGWGGAWQDDDDGVLSVSSASDSAGFITGNTLTVTPRGGTTITRRTLSAPLRSGTVYFSVLADNVSDGLRFLSLSLLDAKGAEKVSVGQRAVAREPRWGVHQGAKVNDSPVSTAGEGPTLLVLRIDFDHFGPDQDAVRLYVNPQLGGAEPGKATVPAKNFGDLGELHAVALGAGHTNGVLTTTVARFDELYVADSWESLGSLGAR
jgi:hypothetical protein